MKELEQSHSEVFIPLKRYQSILEAIDCSRYTKLSSMIQLQRVGLPTLPGFVITDINDHIIQRVERWLTETGSERLSLRFDSPNPEDNKRLTLSNPSLEEFSRMRDLLKPPVVGIVLAENDRFNQNHSVLIQFFDDSIGCEIVGPGFDAADLTRGHSSPHEILEFYRRDSNYYTSPLTSFDIKYHQITNQNYYNLSRLARLGVINAVLEKGLGRSVAASDLSLEQVGKVENFLHKRGAGLPQTYQPISYQDLQKLYRYITELDAFRDYYKSEFGLDVSNRVLSSSFLKKHGLVFWDIYGGEKYRKR